MVNAVCVRVCVCVCVSVVAEPRRETVPAGETAERLDGWIWMEVGCVSQGVGYLAVLESQLHSKSERRQPAQKQPPALSGFQESTQCFTITSQQLGDSQGKSQSIDEAVLCGLLLF